MANRLVDALLKAKKKAEDLARSAYQNTFQTNKTSLISPVASTVYRDTPLTKNIKTVASAAKGAVKQAGDYAGDIYQGGKATTKLVARAVLPDRIAEQNLARQRAITESMALARKKGNTQAVESLFKSGQGAYEQSKQYLTAKDVENRALLGKQQRGTTIGASAILGGPKLLTKGGAVTAALSGAINAGVAKFEGRNASEEFGRGAIKAVPVLAMSRFTDPTITKIAGAVSPKLTSTAIQVARRLITGAGNVAEGKILSKMDQTDYTSKQAGLDFVIGAAISPKANEELGKIAKKSISESDLVKKVANFLKKNPEVVKKVQEKAQVAPQVTTRNVKFNYMGQEQVPLTVKETAQQRRGSNQFDRKYKDFIPAGSTTPKQMTANAFGGAAGIEYEKDENGKIIGVKYDTAKGAAGLALTAGLTSPQGKKIVGDVLEKIPQSIKNIKADVDAGVDVGLEKFTKLKNFEAKVKPQTAQLPRTGTSKVSLPELGTTTTKDPELQINSKAPQIDTSKSIITPKNITPEQVASEIPAKLDKFVKSTLGYTTVDPKGGKQTASAYTQTLRKGQEIVTRNVEKALGSDDARIRTAASTIQGFFKGIGVSPERAQASTELRGGLAVANQRAFDVMDSLYTSLGNNKKSLERINAVLDPEISKFKLTYDGLTPKEKKVHDLIRTGFDLVHDTSYANGNIAQDLYTKNKGKYVPRLYQPFELPEEVNNFVNSSTKKVQTDLYKSRTDINTWKTEESLNDPVYGLGKRLAQVETNKAIKGYTDFLSKNADLVSDVEKPGFVKLSDSKAYGSLAGKYVLNSAAEDLKGHFFANQGVQNLYDAFRAFDRLPIRQLQKKLLTVFNPTTNVGNIVSDNVFGFMVGVDPLTLNKNIASLNKDKTKFKQLSDYLLRNGVTGTDITRSDFTNRLSSVDELAKNAGKKAFKLSTIPDKIQEFYGGTDDIYKVAAFKSLLDQGKTLEEATRLVSDGFQNYANVGKFYDVWAKTPIAGSAFIKFQGDLIRIIKNAVVNRPLQLITFLGTLKGIAELSSRVSGETKEDKKTREERFAAPMIPGLNIPLTWQTPWGEINVARYISPFYANNDVTDMGKMLPGIGTAVAVARDLAKPNADLAGTVARNVNDPLLSPFVQLAVNRDFRGKRISDPNESKYKTSTLTSGEKLANQAKFLTRSYTPPLGNTAVDINSAAQGEPDFYGRTRTVPQAITRAMGVKVEQFGPEQAQAQREKDSEFAKLETQRTQSNIRSVFNDVYDNNLPFETANKRIQEMAGEEGGSREIAEALHAKIMSLPKEERGLAYQKAAKYITSDIKKEMLAISELENKGLSSEDRLLLTVPVELRARQVHDRIMKLSAKSRAKKYQELVDGGVITPEMKSIMLKLLQGK